MDRRLEPRISSYQTVTLTILGNAGFSMQANAIDFSAHGMRLVLDQPIPVNAAIKVSGNDWMALGDVCYCKMERSHYAVGLHLDQALVGLEHMARYRETLTALNEAEQLIA
jgi:hypothetical protein